MVISIFGLGYVGCILSAGHSSMNHKIIGVDVDKKKIELLNQGKSPVMEQGVEGYLFDAVKKNLFEAGNDVKKAISQSNLSLIAVGTPSKSDGSIDLTYTKKVCEQIATELRNKSEYHVIVFKSTLFPGIIENQLIPLIENISDKKAGIDFGVCHNPEFLREGNGMHDFFNPPTIVIGQLDKKSGDMLAKIYEGIEAPIIRTSIKIGEMIKYVNNSFHALKIAFANEIGNIASQVGINSYELMKIFVQDTYLNISSRYFLPGTPFGGSCLTKDPDALIEEAKKLNISVPLINSIKKSNDYHISYSAEKIASLGKKKIGIIGLSFKENTDDLRASPTLYIIDILKKKGFEILIYDNNVSLTEKFGANKEIFEKLFFDVKSMLSNDLSKVVNESDVLVVKHKFTESNEFLSMLSKDKILVDINRIFDKNKIKGKYITIN